MSEGTEMHIDPHDTLGKKIGILAAILAVLLSVFTISAHRAHTATIELQNETNDIWSQYQAKRIRDYQLEMNSALLTALAPTNPETAKLVISYSEKHKEYAKELDELKMEADTSTAKNVDMQKKALYFDLAEGVLEISLVMSSLYFISHKKLFPMFGLIFGIIGAVAGVIGLLI